MHGREHGDGGHESELCGHVEQDESGYQGVKAAGES